jgi:hypothetical protein
MKVLGRSAVIAANKETSAAIPQSEKSSNTGVIIAK